nr:MAG TPA: hypothetical protein [Caudoviricetes sp.]
MKKQTTTGVGLNGCGIARVKLAAAQAQIAAMRAGVMPNAAGSINQQVERKES